MTDTEQLETGAQEERGGCYDMEGVSGVTSGAGMEGGGRRGLGGGGKLVRGVRAGDAKGKEQGFEAALRDAAQSALFGRKTMGLQPLSTGWEVVRYDAVSDAWQRVDRSDALQMPVAWSIAGLPYPAPATRTLGTEPPIRILGDGRMTQFELRLGAQEEARPCRATRLAQLSCQGAGG